MVSETLNQDLDLHKYLWYPRPIFTPFIDRVKVVVSTSKVTCWTEVPLEPESLGDVDYESK